MNADLQEPVSRGCWVTFEGTEGTGKSTQIDLLARRLKTSGHDPVRTREPGGTEVGRRLRRVLLESTATPMSPWTELLLYAADRSQHLTEIVLPAIDSGLIVLCDRYLDATLAYQGFGRGLGVEPILELHRRPPLDARPDRTVLLDLPPAEALERARIRNRELGLEASEGRFEAEELAFHRRVLDGYRTLATGDPHRFRIVDARGTPESVAHRVASCLADLLPLDPEPDGEIPR